MSFAKSVKLNCPLGRLSRLRVPVFPDVDDVRFSYVPLGKPIWIWEKWGFVSVKLNWRSRLVLTESVLFAFVGLTKRREVGAVVSIVILYAVVLVAWLSAESFTYIVKL